MPLATMTTTSSTVTPTPLQKHVQLLLYEARISASDGFDVHGMRNPETCCSFRASCNQEIREASIGFVSC